MELKQAATDMEKISSNHRNFGAGKEFLIGLERIVWLFHRETPRDDERTKPTMLNANSSRLLPKQNLTVSLAVSYSCHLFQI